jgi:hypothetical protein
MADTVDREGSGDWRSVDGVRGKAVEVGLHRDRGRARDRRKRERGWTGGEGRNAHGKVQGTLLAVEEPSGMGLATLLGTRGMEGTGGRGGEPNRCLMPTAEHHRRPQLCLHDQQAKEEHAPREAPGQLHGLDYRSHGSREQASPD